MAMTDLRAPVAGGYQAPALAFAVALLVGFAAWVLAANMLARDAVLPVVVTLLFCLAAVAALMGSRRSSDNDQRPSYRDVAGALTFIGICAAAAIDPDQLVRIVEGGGTLNQEARSSSR